MSTRPTIGSQRSTPSRLDRAMYFASLPPEWPNDARAALTSALVRKAQKVVVLDDDPTGTQTVHGVAVLTEWSVASLGKELGNDLPAFFVLTNTRSLPLSKARSINAEIGRNLVAAAKNVGRDFVVVSRSDSTLRGHFPGEVDALAAALERRVDAFLLIPFFLEGGRFTVDDVQYVAAGDMLVPAGETQYAWDHVFGYRNSNLKDWVEEKTLGRVVADDVASISLDDIRSGGPGCVAEKLSRLAEGGVCVVNAVSMSDLEVFTLGLLEAEGRQKHFVYRTASSFVAVRAGIEVRPPLSAADVRTQASVGGLIVVGSHVPVTSVQIAALRTRPNVKSFVVEVEALLDDERHDTEVVRISESAATCIEGGEDALIFTSRDVVSGSDADSSLRIAQKVSKALIAIVRGIRVRPRFVIAKGGITASDVATKGLGVRRAMVIGQILPGVPVWRLGPESAFPDLVFVVFPGNVGSASALADAVATLRGAP